MFKATIVSPCSLKIKMFICRHDENVQGESATECTVCSVLSVQLSISNAWCSHLLKYVKNKNENKRLWIEYMQWNSVCCAMELVSSSHQSWIKRWKKNSENNTATSPMSKRLELNKSQLCTSNFFYVVFFLLLSIIFISFFSLMIEFNIECDHFSSSFSFTIHLLICFHFLLSWSKNVVLLVVIDIVAIAIL